MKGCMGQPRRELHAYLLQAMKVIRQDCKAFGQRLPNVVAHIGSRTTDIRVREYRTVSETSLL